MKNLHIPRRQFLKGMAAVGASSCIPSTLLAQSASNSPVTAVNVRKLFNQALAKKPALIGFANVEKNFESTTLILEGRIPTDLNGIFYRNGPAKHERNNQRYQHLFEGDGMLQQFRISDGKIVHQGKFIDTPKYSQEQRAQRFLYSGPQTKFSQSLAVARADTINTANTNIIAVGEDLWALWEAGSPTKVDPNTLAYKETVNLGHDSKYGDTLKGLPFSAHPKIAPNGDIFNFGLHGSGHIVLYHLSPDGRSKNVVLIDAQYRGGMLHDFLITDKHLLLILPSLKTKSQDPGYFSATYFDKDQAMEVLVVDKNSLAVKKRYQLAPGFVFHFGNAWEETDGTIHFDASLYPNADVLDKMSLLMQGKTPVHDAHAQTALIQLNPNGSSNVNFVGSCSEFPRIFQHLTGVKNRDIFHLSRNNDSLWSDSVNCLNVSSGKQDSYHYGSDFLVEEHVPICPTRVEGTGYLMGTALHVPSRRTCLNIFEAANLAAGPIARAWLPHHLPLGFHGNFVSS